MTETKNFNKLQPSTQLTSTQLMKGERKMLTVINFGEMPLDREVRAQVSRLLQRPIRVIEPCLYTGLSGLRTEAVRSYVHQVEAQSPWVWQDTVVLVLPDSGFAAAIVLDEVHRRLGYLPPVARIHQSVEIIDLQPLEGEV